MLAKVSGSLGETFLPLPNHCISCNLKPAIYIFFDFFYPGFNFDPVLYVCDGTEETQRLRAVGMVREDKWRVRALLELQMGLQHQTEQRKLIPVWSCRHEDIRAQDWQVTLVLQAALWTPAARGRSCVAGGSGTGEAPLHRGERAGWGPQLSKDKVISKSEQPFRSALRYR